MKDRNWAYFAAGALLGAEAIDEPAIKLTVDVLTDVFRLVRQNSQAPEDSQTTREAKLGVALSVISRDMHMKSSQGKCPTCKEITELVGKPFGCEQKGQ